MKKKNIVSLILYIIGAVCIAYGAAVLSVIGTGHWFNFAFVIAGAALLALGRCLPAVFEWTGIGGAASSGSFEESSGKTGGKSALSGRRIFLAAVCILIACMICVFAVFEGKVIKFAHSVPREKASWIIVLGAKVKPGNIPSLEYSVRLDAAAEYLRAESISAKKENASGKASTRLLLTGGKGADEPASEASIGCLYLENRPALIKIGNDAMSDISPDMIYLEEKSTSTTENLRNAMEIIKAAGGSSDDSVVIISSSFHLYRASVIAEKEGFTNVSFCGSSGLKILMPFYYCREFAAFVREGL